MNANPIANQPALVELETRMNRIASRQEKEQRSPAQANKQSTKGRTMAVRVFFQVEGSGHFRAGACSSASAPCAWVRYGSVLMLIANPAPGFRFSHWVINDNFAGSNRTRRISPKPGLTVKAVFVPLTSPSIR